MKATLKNSLNEIYKEKNNNNFTFNGNINSNSKNTSNNIIVNNNKNTNTNTNKNNTNKYNKKNSNTNKNTYINVNTNKQIKIDENKETNTIYKNQGFKINITTFFIILFFIFVSILGLFFYYKDKIIIYIKKYLKIDDEVNELKNEMTKKNNEASDLKIKLDSLEKEKENIKKENEKEKEKEKENEKNKKEEKKKIDDKIKNLKQTYSDSQIVKNDGYCYIGSDNNMRHCVEVYGGEVCESGDIYNRIDQCLVPTLRN